MKASQKDKETMRKYYQTHKDILRHKKREYYLTHKEIWKKYQNTDHYRELMRGYNKQARLDAINAYGGKCKCCGEDRFEFLAIDHINGGGIQHRKQLGWAGNSLAKWLKKNNYPQGFRVLCHNCNLALGFYKHCPHTM